MNRSKAKTLTTASFAVILSSMFIFTSCKQVISIHPADRQRIDRFTTTMQTTKTALNGIDRELHKINMNATYMQKELSLINRNAIDLKTKLTSLEDSLNGCQKELQNLRTVFGVPNTKNKK